MESVHPIRAFRLRQKPPMRLAHLAEKLHTSKGNLSRIENGKQQLSDDLLPRVIEECAISLVELRPDLAALLKEKEPAQ